MEKISFGPIIQAPKDAEAWDNWRTALVAWRDKSRKELHYDDGLYNRPEFAWSRRCFSCAFVMMCDETFYDHHVGRYTLEAFLQDGINRFGGYDAIVLWHAYPNIGIDDRNQFDFYRDMPGGLAGLRSLSDEAHRRGFHVFIAYNPWDTGTRREAQGDNQLLGELVQAIDADGIFLDTMRYGGVELRQTLDDARPGVVLESENELPLEYIEIHQMSWAQWFEDSLAPGVLRNKWFEPRHMMHQIHRWDHDHTDELHTAWMNGTGMLVWENVFGSWVGWTPRDRDILRAITPIQRRYADLFTEGTWTPLINTMADGIYASEWDASGIRLWTLVNRTNEVIEGELLRVETDGQLFDLLTGLPLVSTSQDNEHRIIGRIMPRGIGAFVAVDHVNADFRIFLEKQAALKMSQDITFPAMPVSLKPVAPTLRKRRVDIPAEMALQEGDTVHMEISYRVRECGFYESAPYIENWSPLPNFHEKTTVSHTVTLATYAIDKQEVTNRQFKAFLENSGYTPKHPESFLKHWENDSPKLGEEEWPVVYVDLDDARAYCAWTQKRLPTEDEWQYALQNNIVGYGAKRVWNWTESERSDGHTRFSILKGGTDFRALGSDWYADGGPQSPDFGAKFLLMWPGLDRCETIGFRGVIDLVED